MKTLYVRRFASWAPGLEGGEQWREWAEGKKRIEASGTAPALEFANSLFRRRLSQISRMTLQVLHEIMPIGEETKLVFVSFRGEIQQQFKINRMLFNEGDVSPAAFSQSVFNTPPAAAAIALNLRAGYTAVYPGGDRFATGFLAAAAPLLSGRAGEIVLVYADELCPPEYRCPRESSPLAFAALLGPDPPGIPVSPDMAESSGNSKGNYLDSPQEFLAYLYLYGARK
jgi:hypothetical protein